MLATYTKNAEDLRLTDEQVEAVKKTLAEMEKEIEDEEWKN
jgi:hypothetical protein